MRYLKQILDESDKMQAELEQQLLNEMPKAKNPLERMQQENQARITAQEIANQAISEIYRPQTNETEQIENFLEILKQS